MKGMVTTTRTQEAQSRIKRGALSFYSVRLTEERNCRHCYFSFHCSLPGKMVRCPSRGVWACKRPKTLGGKIQAFLDRSNIVIRGMLYDKGN